MSGRQNMFRDPDKRAAKRARQREAAARGAVPTTAKAERASQSQMTHASGSKARKRRREGEKQSDAARSDGDRCPTCDGDSAADWSVGLPECPDCVDGRNPQVTAG